MARPEEIASVVGFLAGGGASYLAATTIFADGGMEMAPSSLANN
jgi:glucose 1-dehydrogenase